MTLDREEKMLKEKSDKKHFLITPPLPESLWFRIREIQTKNLDCDLNVKFWNGKVKEWTLTISEEPESGRQDIRLQASEKK